MSRHGEVVGATRDTERVMRAQVVPVNVYETDGALVVVAPVPAVQPSDVTIEVWPGRMRVTAHVRSAPPRTYLVHEWDYGGYERELDLPDGFGSSVDARLANGQLAVRLRRGEVAEKVTISPNSRPNA